MTWSWGIGWSWGISWSCGIGITWSRSTTWSWDITWCCRIESETRFCGSPSSSCNSTFSCRNSTLFSSCSGTFSISSRNSTFSCRNSTLSSSYNSTTSTSTSSRSGGNIRPAFRTRLGGRGCNLGARVRVRELLLFGDSLCDTHLQTH